MYVKVWPTGDGVEVGVSTDENQYDWQGYGVVWDAGKAAFRGCG